jgi:hypothetical protein
MGKLREGFCIQCYTAMLDFSILVRYIPVHVPVGSEIDINSNPTNYFQYLRKYHTCMYIFLYIIYNCMGKNNWNSSFHRIFTINNNN